MNIVLFQPDIPQNTGTILRYAACTKSAVHIIEPCGFLWNNRLFKRSSMDYIHYVWYKKYLSWQHFLNEKSEGRLILMTTKSQKFYHQFSFHKDDFLIFGQESAGVPDFLHQSVNHTLKIPMADHCRSLNLALSVSIITSHALIQTQQFPYHPSS